MANRNNIIDEFIDGKEKGRASSLRIEGNSKGTALYSYATPIAYRDKESKNIYMTNKKFSVTTSKQQNALKGRTGVFVENNEDYKRRLEQNGVSFSYSRL